MRTIDKETIETILVAEQFHRSAAPRNLARSIMPVSVERVEGLVSCRKQDVLAIEEPLQIRLNYEWKGKRAERDIAITMRTPGHDTELAIGYLFSEGILQSADQILRVGHSHRVPSRNGKRNSVTIDLRPGIDCDLQRLKRNFYVSSSCGVCGKLSIEAVRSRICFPLPSETPLVDLSAIPGLPDTLRHAQSVFDQTGGIHAAALFDATGSLLSLREDVGRHNAVDKLIGAEFMRARLPLRESLILVSGRASFELVQKALMAGIPIMIAVGAPSSLAVEMALRFRMTLVGFLRGERFNVYSGAFRICRPGKPENQA
jgi:FdhD protein